MNFLLRHSPSNAAAASTTATSSDSLPPVSPWLKKIPSQTVTTLESSIAVEKSLLGGDNNNSNNNNNSNGVDSNRDSFASNYCDFGPLEDKHVDVEGDHGWITIPFKKLPDDWGGAPDIEWLQSMDRSFVFPGEQVHIVACLSASKQDTDLVTPFKVPDSKDKNGIISESESQSVKPEHNVDEKSAKKVQVNVSASESYRKEAQTLLEKFKDSHFFVRISESGESLWSERSSVEKNDDDDDNKGNNESTVSAIIDTGRFDARASGGVARNSVKCSSLANGDVVVLLQVNISVDSIRDPILEILQFEKYHDRTTTSLDSDIPIQEDRSSCQDLLKWLLPLDNSQLPVNRPLPPLLNSSHKSSFSASAGSQLFSFGHFRSYSMSSLPQNNNANVSSSPSVSSNSLKPNFDLEDWDRFGSQKSVKSQRSGNQGLMSFRGVPLEPDRFSVCCGLEGIYVPGRRWRKQLEIIQPVDIHSFAANCNTDDLLCVQVKNICPAHVPDIVVYIDAITIILEEASKAGQILSIPIACIEVGASHSLPNLALRRGEEHSFILKPAISALKNFNIQNDKKSKMQSKVGSKSFNTHLPPVIVEGVREETTSHKYAVLVSCRSNYSESSLFFKKPTDWRPRISRDFMISVASEISKQTPDITGKVSHLPVQVLTLQASNLTSEDLTLTLLAPASFTLPPSVLSLNSSPTSQLSPFSEFKLTQNLSTITHLSEGQSQSASQTLSSDQQGVPVATASSCTHLWLHSRVPLGHVPSQSTAKIKLKLLPLTDGIITLDTLQIYVKEKDQTYIPEHALKINATSSIATGII